MLLESAFVLEGKSPDIGIIRRGYQGSYLIELCLATPKVV